MYRKNGIWLLPKLFCNTTIALQAAGQAEAHRRGRWARRALGAQGKRAMGAGRAGAGHWVSGRRALGRVTRRRAASGRTRWAPGMSGRHAGARAATQPRGCCDTAPVRAVRAAMHGLGVAWCAGWASWGLMQPVWLLTWVFDSGVFLSHRMDSVHEHCSSRNFSKKKIFF